MTGTFLRIVLLCLVVFGTACRDGSIVNEAGVRIHAAVELEDVLPNIAEQHFGATRHTLTFGASGELADQLIADHQAELPTCDVIIMRGGETMQLLDEAGSIEPDSLRQFLREVDRELDPSKFDYFAAVPVNAPLKSQGRAFVEHLISSEAAEEFTRASFKPLSGK